MKVLFKNSTEYNKENCKDFEEFDINKFGKKRTIKYILYLLVFAYIIICNIIYKNWIFLLVAVIIGLIWYFYQKGFILKKKNKKKSNGRKFTFYFYERYIKIKYKKQFDRILYFDIKKVYETDTHFFLYLTPKSSLILSKEGFEIGTSKEFSDFIKKKCLFKYKNETK